MDVTLLAGLFLPLAGFITIFGLSSILPRRMVEVIGPGVILLSFLSFLFGHSQSEVTLFTWIPLKGFWVDFSLHLDHLSRMMTLIITGVGFLIHAYSIGYMDHDKDLARYFCVMNFFIFSMLLLVLAANLLVLFVGWEGVGVASYLLIGYWYERPAASKAAKKAFVVNRIGDFGLLLGIFLTFVLFGTSDIQVVCQKAGSFAGTPTIAILGLLYFFGATAKSAQIPLHTWLPDAMEGPTPVSALIHAATMVTAGVYLVVRMHPVFEAAPIAMQVVATTGAITALFAALSATSQTDIKRVLAYSTVSQLGLMFLAAGLGAYDATMFHLMTHAFVKALLFLAAGNVIHMLHGTTEMAKMGGLAHVFPKTNRLFLIGVLSMAGIPPLAIFFSKDLILEAAHGNTFCYIAGLSVTLLTAFYLTRAYVLTFRGTFHGEPVKDAPSIMVTPVTVLGLLAIFGSLLRPELASQIHLNSVTLLSVGVAVSGVVIGTIFYKLTCNFFFNAFYINQLYQYLIVSPARWISRVIAGTFEPRVFLTSLEIAKNASLRTASALQTVQNGQIRSYIAWLIAGASILIIYLSLESA